MKAEAWIFVITTIFFALVSPAYWFITGDWTGTSALVMATLLVAMVSLYLGFHAARMEPRPEDRKDGEIADGAGELGFFPPYSWWPLWCALTLGVCVLGVVIGWWLFIIGLGLGALALQGWIFEYYRGVHAH
ncbi:cytochrome c oxidase subunit 4 [Nocardioides donggukensis]|uniref:Cytochrome c oxidase polypeptide 4 n=1 Tax=Nocardioides donggukensis TaxID=2774019 RepID=A0A927K7A4_9ACTN|nr:cytochrome c oxidase subunit 4 [Nocardioides donggukensis]MBD8869126.1 cytochrome c oxidase subunit 4 [Nocardioides donggukensis]